MSWSKITHLLSDVTNVNPNTIYLYCDPVQRIGSKNKLNCEANDVGFHPVTNITANYHNVITLYIQFINKKCKTT